MLNSKLLGCLSIVALTAGCMDTSGLDFDLRNTFGGRLDTSDAARNAVGARPQADARGIITYPNYQVAVARRGETVESVAARIGVDAPELAAYNGRSVTDRMLIGSVLALPSGLKAAGSSASVQTSNDTSVLTPTIVDVTELAPAAVSVESGPEPIRHRVQAGETAFTIARRYNVPAESIREWNGLGSDLQVSPGQLLLIPVSLAGTTTATALPGNGSLTPNPPSSTRPQPRDVATTASTAVAAVAPKPALTKPVADIGNTTVSSAAQSRFQRPVAGSIIRDYKKGRNEGIDIGAAAGTSVVSADGGQVVAITKDTNGVPFLVVKHTKTLVTVYSNISDIAVKQGQTVKRGQKLAVVQSGSPSFLHFEVRKGLDSIDPNEFF